MQVGEKVTRSAQLITTPSGRTTEMYCGSTGSSTGAGVGVGKVVGEAIGGDLTRGVACFFSSREPRRLFHCQVGTRCEMAP